MKREFMLSMIRGQLEQFKKCVEKSPELANEIIPNFANGILTLQEIMGISPPPYEPFPGSETSFHSREWEPVDEKK